MKNIARFNEEWKVIPDDEGVPCSYYVITKEHTYMFHCIEKEYLDFLKKKYPKGGEYKGELINDIKIEEK